MTNTRFINQLLKWYGRPVIKGSKITCKFYLQANTFSYELHDMNETCFTNKSLMFESKVFWWGGKENNNKIIESIKSTVVSINKQINK